MLVHLLDKLIASKLIEVSNGDEVTSPSQVVQMSKKMNAKNSSLCGSNDIIW